MLSLYFFYLLYSPIAISEDPSLAVNLIPDDLIVNANAVVRYENTTCKIKRLDKLIITKKKALTILNDKDESMGVISIHYTDNVEKIKDLKIRIYDAEGKLIKKVKKDEINDISVFDGFTIADDARSKYYYYTPSSYPYTIAYEYSKESKNTLYIPAWYPASGTGVSVQENNYSIECTAPDFELMYIQKNTDQPSIEVNEKDYQYTATNLSAIKYEPKAPYVGSYFPLIKFIPSKFSYFGIEGSFSNWEEYGKWMYDHMLKNRGFIPDDVIREVDARIPEGSTKEEIARIVYDYVTGSTRYVSVQLGIGGFKPFHPRDVYDLKYGDCKALSFYTATILDYYGIEAIYTEIRSERRYAIDYEKELPGPFQGNHIVLCLPNEGDTTWLECTTGAYFFGYAHSGIDDRRALLITPEGGKLIKTKKYSAEENLARKTAHLKIGPDHIVDVKMKNTFYNQRHESRTPLVNEAEQKREEFLRKYIFDHLPQYELESYDIHVNAAEKNIEESAEMRIDKLIEKAGYYIILPYMVAYIDAPQKLDKNRKQDIYIKTAKKDAVTLTVDIPEGYQMVEEEKDLNFVNAFGSIKVNKEKVGESAVRISAEIEYSSGTFPSAEVGAYNIFAEKVDNFLRDKIIFKPTN